MSAIDIAIEYYQALYSANYARVRELASSSLIFEDSTAPDELGIPPRLDTLEAFLQFMQANLTHDVEIRYTDKFVSNDRVVLTVETQGKVSASQVGINTQAMVTYQSQGISVLHVVDGKVIRIILITLPCLLVLSNLLIKLISHKLCDVKAYSTHFVKS